MLFSSLVFLCIFLPLLLLIYYTVPRRLRNLVLLIASLIFYGWGEPRLLSVMIVFIGANYLSALLLDRFDDKKWRTIFLTLGIILDLGVLCYFKYMDFFIANFNRLTGCSFGLLHIVMPIGISFYTFQAISYLVDVFRRDVAVEKNLLRMGLYISFFPQLIAGPIIKFHEISAEIVSRKETLDDFSAGMTRFLEGLAKKVLIANTMGAFVDDILNGGNWSALMPADMWLCAIAYSFQIFFDFSGYSDMAIGLGQMFGFHIPENFNYPYTSCTVTEFWRRWHISLSTWFKEYLYIPLGGSRCSMFRTCINLLIVFSVTGFWHGSSWTFLLWGLWHGFFILIERITGLNKKVFSLPIRIIQHLALLLIVLIGWVFFRADDFTLAFSMLNKMFDWDLWWHDPVTDLSFEFLSMFIAAIFFSTSLPRIIYERLKDYVFFQIGWKVISLGLLYLSYLKLAASSYNPFIYFRF